MDPPVKLEPQGARCGLTRIPIDRPCLSPDLSAARERLAVGFASPMPVTREGPDLHGLVSVLSMHSVTAKPFVHGMPEAGNDGYRRKRTPHRWRRRYTQGPSRRSGC